MVRQLRVPFVKGQERSHFVIAPTDNQGIPRRAEIEWRGG